MRTAIWHAARSKWLFVAKACLILAMFCSAALADDPGPASAGKDAAAVPLETAEPRPDGRRATHRQVRRIEFSGGVKLASFCLLPDGRIVAALEPADPVADASSDAGLGAAVLGLFSGKQTKSTAAAEKPLDGPSEIRLLDPQGKLVKRWPVKFKVQAVNVDSQGQIFAGGEGQLASFDQDGRLLATSEAPQIPAVRANPDALRAQAQELLDSQKNAVQDFIKSTEEQLKQYAGKSDKELSAEERADKQQKEFMLKHLKSGAVRISAPTQTIEQVEEQLLSQRKRINALAASDRYVFITCGATKGYGYAVWRVDRKFENPKMIVKSLSGCCGQMDIQCDGDELVVAENSRHRVVRYSAEGKQISSFGKRSRDGQLECFGGCCNPMNLQARGDRLYVSESDGQVKLFQKDGKFLALVGVAEVKPGCKSSSIGVAADGKRVYYIDVNNSAILLLEPKAAALSSTK